MAGVNALFTVGQKVELIPRDPSGFYYGVSHFIGKQGTIHSKPVYAGDHYLYTVDIDGVSSIQPFAFAEFDMRPVIENNMEAAAFLKRDVKI